MKQIENIKVQGIVTAVPKNEFDNTECVKEIGNRRLKKQIQLTGIDKRRITVEGQYASDLATIAAEELLQKIGWEKDSIKVLIFVTQSPDLVRPSTAYIIQQRLKLGNDCIVFDINQGCTGYITGLITICGILNTIKGRGLFLVGESNACEGSEINHGAFLEGDAAAATALEFAPDAMPLDFAVYNDGARANLLYKRMDGYSFMDGNAVLLFGLNDVANGVKKFIANKRNEIDYFVFHQAQKMIVDGIVQEADIPQEKVLLSYQNFGNTSSVAIPLTLCVNKKEGCKKVLLCGFGIGLSWGMVLLDIDFNKIFPLLETNEYYDDRKQF